MSEEEKRFYQRDLTRKDNYSLNQTAKKAGVKNFDKFHNAGYKGLYGGETANDIAKRKGLRYREDILDNMGSVELAANLFRITQTDEKLKKDNIKGENNANKAHYKIGKNIREVIRTKVNFYEIHLEASRLLFSSREILKDTPDSRYPVYFFYLYTNFF